MDQLPRLGKRELICLLSFTCNYVVFVWRGFLFLCVLGMGYVILLWHSLSLPYNYLVFYCCMLAAILEHKNILYMHLVISTCHRHLLTTPALTKRHLNHCKAFPQKSSLYFSKRIKMSSFNSSENMDMQDKFVLNNLFS